MKKPFPFNREWLHFFISYHSSFACGSSTGGPKAPEAARPERAEAPSPGHRPGYDGNQQDAL